MKHKKRTIQMIIALIVILLLALFRNGVFSDSRSLKETFTSPEMEALISGGNWTYYVSKEAVSDVRPYFINSDGKAIQGQPIAKGLYFYKTSQGSIKASIYENKIILSKHFLLGENRWYRKVFDSSQTKYAIIKMEWIEDERKHYKIIKSDIFDDEDIEKFKKILKDYKVNNDKGYLKDSDIYQIYSTQDEYKPLFDKVKASFH